MRVEPPTHALRHFIPLIFLLVGGTVGGYFLLTVPPYQGPDEPNHLFRAYAISTGELEPRTDHARRGGEVPTSLVAMFDTFAGLRWWRKSKTEWPRVTAYGAVPLAAGRTTFVDYPNTAVYPAPVYLPAAAGLVVARTTGASALTTLRLARGGGLLCWLVAGAGALWLLPCFRGLFLALLLLPMSLFTHGVVSADTFTDAVAVVTVAYLLRLAYGRRPDGSALTVDRRRLGWLLLLTVLLVTAKLVYTPLLLLALLIPAERFTLRGGRGAAGAVVVASAVVVLLFWSARAGDIYLPYVDYSAEHREGLDLPAKANVPVHRDLVLAAPHRLFRAVGNSAVQAAPMYVPGYIGTFGWLDQKLPPVVVGLAYAWLLLIALCDRGPGPGFGWRARLTVLLAFLACYHLVILSQLLSWEPVGSHRVGTVQGRYLTPFAPLLFLLLNPNRRGGPPAWLLPVVVAGALLLAAYSGGLVYFRYYGS